MVSPAAVEWQIVGRNGPTDPGLWQQASGFDAWSFGFQTGTYGRGPHTIVVRVVYDDVELARQTVAVKFR